MDFLLGREVAVEVKASKKISRRDFKGLKALKEEGIFKTYIMVSQDRVNAKDDDFQALFWEYFLDDLWSNRMVQ